ncbi:MAG TPA: hypothetical protein DD471_09745 [Planctomycetes bacterium]|jgi:hypothetical protein|nr:hypothetical protein [Planctomycetota bacterium]
MYLISRWNKDLKISWFTTILLAAGLMAGLFGCGSDESEYTAGGTPHDFSGDIERGPQLALASTRSMTIAWRSLESTEPAVVYWSANGLPSTRTGDRPGTEHVIELDGLLPDTAYFYQLQHGARSVGEVHNFWTAADTPDAAIRFGVFGDFGCGCPAQYESIGVLKDSQPDLVLTTGDNVYYSGSAREVRQNYFIPMASLIDHVPVYPSLGNHDVITGNGSPFLDSLYLPVNDADGSERFYSFDRGNCHFIALEVTDRAGDLSPGSRQYQWLVRDLQRTAATWVVCYFHHPLYSDSSHGDAPLLQIHLAPLFDEYGVDVVLSGHDHTYQRTYPMRAGLVLDGQMEPNYTDPQGTIYVVTGGGGATLYGLWRSQRLAAGESRRHVVIFDVVGNELNLSAVDYNGSVFDRMKITKRVPGDGR